MHHRIHGPRTLPGVVATAIATFMLVAAAPPAAHLTTGNSSDVSTSQTTTDEPDTLLANTTFETDGSVTTSLALDTTATVDPDATLGETEGDVAVFVLRQSDQPINADARGIIVTIDQRGVTSTSVLQSIDDVEDHELPAGEYELHVAAEGPTGLSLKFDGAPSGETTIAATTDNGATITTADDLISDMGQQPAGTLHSGGDDVQLARDGLVVSIVRASFDAHAHTRFGGCVYDGHPTGPAPYTPGCVDPGASGRSTPDVGLTFVETGEGALRLVQTTELQAGPHGIGVYWLSASAGMVLDHHVVTLPYEAS